MYDKAKKYRFSVWVEGSSEEFSSSVTAIDEEHAAEVYAECEDVADASYAIAGGKKVTLFIRAPDGELTKRLVSGEMVAEYSSEELEVS